MYGDQLRSQSPAILSLYWQMGATDTESQCRCDRIKAQHPDQAALCQESRQPARAVNARLGAVKLN